MNPFYKELYKNKQDTKGFCLSLVCQVTTVARGRLIEKKLFSINRIQLILPYLQCKIPATGWDKKKDTLYIYFKAKQSFMTSKFVSI